MAGLVTVRFHPGVIRSAARLHLALFRQFGVPGCDAAVARLGGEACRARGRALGAVTFDNGSWGSDPKTESAAVMDAVSSMAATRSRSQALLRDAIRSY